MHGRKGGKEYRKEIVERDEGRDCGKVELKRKGRKECREEGVERGREGGRK